MVKKKNGRQWNLDLNALDRVNLEVVKKFLEENDNLINKKIQIGRTLLHFACIFNRIDVIELLFNKKADFLIRSDSGKNPLHYACEYDAIEAIKYLVEKHPQFLNEEDFEGIIPIFYGKYTRSESFIVYLITQYIKYKDQVIFSAISTLKPAMKVWKFEHFVNYLGEDLKEEYSDSSDEENDKPLCLSDRQLYLKGDFNKAKEILERKRRGKSENKNLYERLNTLINKIEENLIVSSIENFTKAKDRQAYFPNIDIESQVKNWQKVGKIDESKVKEKVQEIDEELRLINEAIRSNSLKIRKNKNGFYEIYEARIKGVPKHVLKNEYFLPCFRGISYLVDRWSTHGRRTHRRLALGNDFINYAEANMLQGSEFYQGDDYSKIDFMILRKNAKLLKKQLIDFKKSESMTLVKKEGKKDGFNAKSAEAIKFQNFLDLLQYMFSNGIKNFIEHLSEFNKEYPGIFPNNRNPFLPFSHLPFHAMRYAFGDKDPYRDFALPPLWDDIGRPRKPHVGKVTLSIHPIRDFLGFDQPNIVPYLTKVAGVTARQDIGPEYEVTFLSYIPEDRLFKQKIIRYPSFQHEKCPTKYLAKYGLNEILYQGFRACILDTVTRDSATQVLKSWLCLFHAIRSMEEVSDEILRRKGIMLFYHPDGKLDANYPTEDYQASSEISRENRLLAKKQITSAIPILKDYKSWGDRRGIYKNDSPPSPRKSPSGSTPNGEKLDLSHRSPLQQSPYSPILKQLCEGGSYENDLLLGFSKLFFDKEAVPLEQMAEVFRTLEYEEEEFEEKTLEPVKESTMKSEKKVKIGPRKIEAWELLDVGDRGNCFYEAVIEQFKQIQHPFLKNVHHTTMAHDSLRLLIQGSNFMDREWADDEQIEGLVQKLDLIVAVIHTAYPEGGYSYRYKNGEEVCITTDQKDIPLGKQMIKLAFTGNHFLSVIKEGAKALSNFKEEEQAEEGEASLELSRVIAESEKEYAVENERRQIQYYYQQQLARNTNKTTTENETFGKRMISEEENQEELVGNENEEYSEDSGYESPSP